MSPASSSEVRRRAEPVAEVAPPRSYTTLRDTILNLTRLAPGQDSMRVKRKVAAWDDDFIADVIET